MESLVFQVKELQFEKHVVDAIKRYFAGEFEGNEFHQRFSNWLWVHFLQHNIPHDKQWRLTCSDIGRMDDNTLIRLWAELDSKI